MTAIIPTKLILDPSPTLSGNLDANGKSISDIDQLSFRELLDDSLVGYWPFVASARDASRYGHDGTLGGNAAIANGILKLPGAAGDFVSLGENDKFCFTNTEYFELESEIDGFYHQGIADDGEFLYTFGTPYLSKKNRTSPYATLLTMQLATIKTAASGALDNCDHIGDGVALGNYIYIPVEKYNTDHTFSADQYIVRLNKSDLTYSTHWDVSAQDPKISGLATDGTYILAISYCDSACTTCDQERSDVIWRYTLAGVYAGDASRIVLSSPMTGCQGITYNRANNAIYASTDGTYGGIDGIYRIEMTGTVTGIVYQKSITGNFEGLDYTQDQMRVAIDIYDPTCYMLVLNERTALSGFSISAWIRPENLTGSRPVIGRWDYIANHRQYILLANGDDLGFWVGRDNGTTSTNLTMADCLALNNWYHVCAVCDYDNQLLLLYLNGGTPSTIAYTGVNVGFTQNTCVGRNTAAGMLYWLGQMADVRMYNRPLSAAEIQKLYSLGVTQYPMARTVCYVTDPAAARPIGYGRVIWTTDTEPTNAIAGDIWIPTA